MGRKSLNKKRKTLTKKAKIWVKELFYELQDKDLNKITLDEIAILAQKSKSTIYTYFKTKEELYETMVLMVLKNLEGMIFEKLPEEANVIKLYESSMLKIGESIEGMSIHFLNQIQTHFIEIWNLIQDFTQKILNTFSLIYEKGMALQIFNPFNISLLLAMDDNFIMYIMTDTQRFENENLSLKNLVNEYLQLRIKALTS